MAGKEAVKHGINASEIAEKAASIPGAEGAVGPISLSEEEP